MDARIESAKRASEIHYQRTGRYLRVRAEDVINEEMYEEEDLDYLTQYRRLSNHIQASGQHSRHRVLEALMNHAAMQAAQNGQIGRRSTRQHVGRDAGQINLQTPFPLPPYSAANPRAEASLPHFLTGRSRDEQRQLERKRLRRVQYTQSYAHAQHVRYMPYQVGRARVQSFPPRSPQLAPTIPVQSSSNVLQPASPAQDSFSLATSSSPGRLSNEQTNLAGSESSPTGVEPTSHQDQQGSFPTFIMASQSQGGTLPPAPYLAHLPPSLPVPTYRPTAYPGVFGSLLMYENLPGYDITYDMQGLDPGQWQQHQNRPPMLPLPPNEMLRGPVINYLGSPAAPSVPDDSVPHSNQLELEQGEEDTAINYTMGLENNSWAPFDEDPFLRDPWDEEPGPKFE